MKFCLQLVNYVYYQSFLHRELGTFKGKKVHLKITCSCLKYFLMCCLQTKQMEVTSQNSLKLDQRVKLI